MLIRIAIWRSDDYSVYETPFRTLDRNTYILNYFEITPDLLNRWEKRRIDEGVREVPRMDRPRTTRSEISRQTSGTRPLSRSEVIQSALREVAQARQHLDSAEGRLQLLLTWAEGTHLQEPEPEPDQFHE